MTAFDGWCPSPLPPDRFDSYGDTLGLRKAGFEILPSVSRTRSGDPAAKLAVIAVLDELVDALLMTGSAANRRLRLAARTASPVTKRIIGGVGCFEDTAQYKESFALEAE